MTLIETIRAAIKWLPDLIAMPARVRSLTEARIAQDDPRPICRVCGVGRVDINLLNYQADLHPECFGNCSHCNTQWRVDPLVTPMVLVQLTALRPRHRTPPRPTS